MRMVSISSFRRGNNFFTSINLLLQMRLLLLLLVLPLSTPFHLRSLPPRPLRFVPPPPSPLPKMPFRGAGGPSRKAPSYPLPLLCWTLGSSSPTAASLSPASELLCLRKPVRSSFQGIPAASFFINAGWAKGAPLLRRGAEEYRSQQGNCYRFTLVSLYRRCAGPFQRPWLS